MAIRTEKVEETITNCGACNESAYCVRLSGPGLKDQTYEPTGLDLRDLKVSSNGTQWWNTRLCRSCTVQAIEALAASLL